ncbi:transcriptional regulator containing an amidase domain and an AraC-type DNA-binding HTH domain protein [Mycobacterium lentiflavum]|uniref:Transcriptional regulator containing an amidase domain and an AraC-type DNA-binding HTH domain protein n=1 Tax=Mycobacterium lentiflavum TaxID=141349 RepID=A0A0E4CM15_MYCLN|nr:helix-turn-helix domain-containing protein [Mycobacterium lentiflavum]CQD07240.1 transcriptional regulator containing an amidase domain and an AraC-type DNA-binding HTH domain protein [Mycobacterium lentiflavum]
MPRSTTNVAVLMFSGASLFEMSVPISVFGMDRSDSGAPKFSLLPIAADGRPVISTGGVKIRAEYGLRDLDTAGIVIVPTWHETDHEADEAQLERTVEAIRNAHADGAIVVGLCMGTFALAAAGLLHGRRAVTHWRHTAELAARYPTVRVDPAVLYVDDGDVVTSAGGTAGLDACLHIVARFWGVKAATAIADRMASPPQRSGAQTQLIPDAILAGGDRARLSEIMEYVVRNLDRQLDIDDLATQFDLSRRTFDRRFREATGLSPVQWVLHQRVFRAQHLLEETDLTVDAIAHHIGLSNAVSLRPVFRRVVGLSPQAYRSGFRSRTRDDRSQSLRREGAD